MFNQRKNKSFHYKPRFSRETDSDTHQVHAEKEKDVVSKWNQRNRLNKRKVKGGISIKIWILVLVLLLICMYVLDKKYM